MNTPTLLTELQTVRRPVAWWGVWVVVAVGLNAAGLLVAFHEHVPPPEVLYLQTGVHPTKVGGADLDQGDSRAIAHYPLDASAGDPAGPVAVEYTIAYPGAEPVPLTHMFDRRPDGGFRLPVPPPPGGLSPDEPTECKVRLRAVSGAVLGPGPRPRREGVLVLPPVPMVQFAQVGMRTTAADAFPGADLYVRGTLRDAPRYAVVSPAADPPRDGLATLVGTTWRVPADALTGLPSAERYELRLSAPRGSVLGRNKSLEVTLTAPPVPVRVAGWVAEPSSSAAGDREARFKLTLTRPAAASTELKLAFVGTGAGRLRSPPDKVALAAGAEEKVVTVALAPPTEGVESAQTVTAVLTVPEKLGGPDSRSAVLTLDPAPVPVRVAGWVADPPSIMATAGEARFKLTLTRPAAADAGLKLTFAGTGLGRLRNPPDKVALKAGDREKVLTVALAPADPPEESPQTVTAALAVPAELGGPGTRNADLTLTPPPPPTTVRLGVRVLGEAVVNPADPDAAARFELTVSPKAPHDIKVAVQYNPRGDDKAVFDKHLTGDQAGVARKGEKSATEVVIKKGDSAATFEVRGVAPAGGRLQPDRVATVRFAPPTGVTADHAAALTQTVRVTERLEDRPLLILVVPPVNPGAAGEKLARVLTDWAGQKDAGQKRWVRQAVVVRKDERPLAVPVAGPADLTAVPKAEGLGPLAAGGRSRAVHMVNDVMDARRDLLRELGKEDRDRVVTVIVWPSALTPAELDGNMARLDLTAEAADDLKGLAPVPPAEQGRVVLMWYSERGSGEQLLAQTAPLRPVAAFLPNRQVRLISPATAGAEIDEYLRENTLLRP